MTENFLKKVPLFAGLSDADIEAMEGMVEAARLDHGELLFSEGDAGDRAYVIREGQLEVFKTSGGREMLLAVRGPGDVIGEMALLENMPRIASVRAKSDASLLAIRKDTFEKMLATSQSAARVLFYTVLERLRSTESVLRHSERMAQLGVLTAGVAHEMNNPAAAVKRGADQLAEAMADYSAAAWEAARLELSDEQRREMAKLGAPAGDPQGAGGAQQAAGDPKQPGDAHQAGSQQPAQQRSGSYQQRASMTAIERSERTTAIEEWLEARGVESPWDLGSTLVDWGYDAARLERAVSGFAPGQVPAALRYTVAAGKVRELIGEVAIGAGRISEIVGALKSYAYLDQAPVQNVDLREGIDNTLVILSSKLKQGVEVRREYAPDLPRIEGYGSELNQVWTNLIDNAVDAMNGSGRLIVRARRDGQGVVVEVEDDGPGIPAEIRPRVFDAFFTTKPPGKGTGLGLNVSYNIVVHRHRGSIDVVSDPGKTCFRVWLPVALNSKVAADSKVPSSRVVLDNQQEESR